MRLIRILSFALAAGLLAMLGYALQTCTDPQWTGYALATGLLLTLVLFSQQLWSWAGSSGLPPKVRWERRLKMLASMMGMFTFSGALLFWWTFTSLAAHEPSLYTSTEFLLRSLLGSLGMFVMELDDNILELIDEKIPDQSSLLKGLLTMQTVLSFTCTIALLLQLLASRLFAYLRLVWVAWFSRRRHVYLFFGLDEPSQLLAESIRANDDEQAIIVLAVNPAMDEEEREGLHSLMQLFASHRKDYAVASNRHTYLTFTSGTLDTLPPDSGMTDVFTALNLPNVRRLVKRLADSGDGRLHVFLLSDQEEQNISGALSLCRDSQVRRLADRCTIHCQGRVNSVNRVVEDMKARCGVEVRLVDSSHLAVELLKRDPASQPVRFVDASPSVPATVASPFHALVIGFDEVGQDALSFLYEFAAFPDQASTEDRVFRSPCHLLAIDRHMDCLAPHYLAARPALRTQLNPDGTPIVRLEQVDTNGEGFYDHLLPSIANQLNYVVIAVGDDDMGITLAVRILQVLRQQRTDAQMQRLRIFVRAYRRDKEPLLQRVADHYNTGAGRPAGEEPLIQVFGKGCDIFSYGMVIDDTFQQRGRVYYDSYQRQAGESQSPTWAQRRQKLTSGTDLDRLRSLRRKEGQDLCNALHTNTKVHLLSQALTVDADFLHRYFNAEGLPDRTGHYGQITYPRLTPEENLVIRHLAWLEHLRWNASHEILGYLPTQDGDEHGCNERTRRHNCLRPWEQLDEESRLVPYDCDYKAYDFAVVDTTIHLHWHVL